MSSEIEPNVVTEQGLRTLVEMGCRLEISCKKDPERRGPSWYGSWNMSVYTQQDQERMLVTARAGFGADTIKVRDFKTVTGVVSFLIGLGFAQVCIPIRQGEKVTLMLKQPGSENA